MTRMLILFTVISFAIAGYSAQGNENVLLLPAEGFDSAQIRLANLIPNAPMLDTYINGELSTIEALAYADISSWVEVPVGQHEIAFVPVGSNVEEALMNPFIVDVAPDAWLTIAATGSLETAKLETQIITENLDIALFTGTTRLTIFFDVDNVSAVNILFNEDIIITGMQVHADIVGSASVDMPVGVYTLQFVNADESQALVTSFEIELQANSSTLVMVTGSQESPQVLVEVTEMGEIADTSHEPAAR
jgi:hypothetical protein